MIAEDIVAALKEGQVAWLKPWKAGMPCNPVSGTKYRGINILMTLLKGKDNCFVTFNQARAKGLKVKKGSKGLPVVYWNFKEVEKDSNPDETRKIPFLRYYTVFNLNDVEGEKVDELRPEVKGKGAFVPNETVEALVLEKGIQLRKGNARAFYSLTDKEICMPVQQAFNSVEEYYYTLLHELGHYAGDALKAITPAKYGTKSYAKEELAAEIFAAFAANHIGIDNVNTFRNTVGYCQGWLKKLEDDPTIIISAANQAQKRFDWLFGIDEADTAKEDA